MRLFRIKIKIIIDEIAEFLPGVVYLYNMLAYTTNILLGFQSSDRQMGK